MELTDLETHPWEPFIPQGARILIMGTFPPPASRWSMNFFYPNPTNDFWPMMGLVFCGDRDALMEPGRRGYNLPAIISLLNRERIAMGDTGYRIRRLRGNASDKFLEIVEPVDLQAQLSRMPGCRAVATTGEKAAAVVATLTGTAVPRMGEYVMTDNGIALWRMPSTSRAYPLKLERKAAYYAGMFRSVGCNVVMEEKEILK